MNEKAMLSGCALLGCLWILSGRVAAREITYVDASGSNLVRVDGNALVPSSAANDYVDSNWSLRTGSGLASHGSVYEAGGGESVPMLKQTVSGLAPGQYEVFAYFWVALSSTPTAVRWQIASGLSDSALVTCHGNNNPAYGPITFTPASVDHLRVDVASLADGTFAPGAGPTQATGGADRTLARHHLGRVWVGAAGTLEVFVRNGPLNTGAASSRTWYDGMGYAPVQGTAAIAGSTWTSGLGAPVLSGASPNGLFWGDGSANNADNTAVHADLDGDLSTPALEPVSLADGQSIALTGTMNMTGVTDTAGSIQFRWGLFDHRGSTDSAGWTGYWASNGTNGNPGALFQQNATSTLYISSNAAHGAYVASAVNLAGAANIGAGEHEFALVLTRDGADLDFTATLRRRSDGAVLTEISGTDHVAAVHFDFTRIGLLAGSLLDADRVTLSEMEVVYPYSLPEPPPPPVPGDIVQVAPDGVWTWFNDERAIWHQGLLYAGYVRADGNAGITRYNHLTGETRNTNIGTATSQQVDDHNNPSLTVLPDNTLLAVYSKHGAASQFYHRKSLVSDPDNLADWSAETIKATPAGNTYANTFRLSGSGPGENNTIYNFSRCINFNPCLTRSTDNGISWGSVTQVINVGTGGTRPYPRYTSNHVDRIDCIYTDGHPRNENNSVYHLYYQGESFRRSDGSLVKSLANLPIQHGAVSNPGSGEKGTVIYQFDPAWGRGWTWDIQYGAGGHPVCVYQTQRDDVTGTGWNHDRIYFHYARWTGTAWQSSFIAQGGRGIYASEDDYGGGMTIDPEDPRVVYISSNAAAPFALGDLDNVPLGANERYEIWRGVTLDGGLTFTWTPVTRNSAANNLRPIVPENHGLTRHVLWLNGTYNTYLNYATKVVGIFDVAAGNLGAWQSQNSLGPDAELDADSDGLSDLEEYALGGDPNDPEDRPVPVLDGSHFTFNHLPERTDVEQVVETSDDLGAWTELAVIRGSALGHTVAPGLTLTPGGGDPATIRLSPLPPAGEPRSFVRLKVRMAPRP